MNRKLQLCIMTALALLSPCASHAAYKTTGNCESMAQSLDNTITKVLSENINVHSPTITRLAYEYEEFYYIGDTAYSRSAVAWMDGQEDNIAKMYQTGGYWYKFTLEAGNDYVLYIPTNSIVVPADLTAGGAPMGEKEIRNNLYMDIYGANFNIYYSMEDATTYYYIGPSDWELYNIAPGTKVPVMVCLTGVPPSVRCQFHHYKKSISEFLPPGLELSPIELDVTEDGSEEADNPSGGYGMCYYKATLEANTRYVFTCTPEKADDGCYISLDRFSDDGTNYEISYDYSQETGATLIRITADQDDEMRFIVGAEDLSACTLSWRKVHVGSLGLGAEEYTFADDAGVARVAVVRSSTDVAHRVKWMTVAETATAGVDYVPASGEISFAAGGESTAYIDIPLVKGANVGEGTKTFAIRLESIPEYELMDEEFSPTPSPKTARVKITPTGSGESAPAVPAAVEEAADTPLATGTFEGVLVDDGDHAAKIEFSAAADGSLEGSLTFGGTTVALTGSAGELAGTVVLKGKTYNVFIDVELPLGTVQDLDYAPDADAATAEGTLYALVDGEVEELFLEGAIYRVESRLDGATLSRMKTKAGRYTVSLPDYGHLTLDVAAGGAVTASGALADGTAVEFTAAANDITGGLAVPFVWTDGEKSLGGTLLLSGKYDYWTDLYRLYNGWRLTLDDKDSPLAGMELAASGDTFEDVGGGATISLNRATGVVSGTSADGRHTFEAILFTADMVQDAIGARGVVRDGAGNTSPLELSLNWTDPDWSEHQEASVTLSFAANGGSGMAPPAISGVIGDKFVLPTNTFARAGYEFTGWLNPVTQKIFAENEEANVPVDDTEFAAQWADFSLARALDSELDFTCTGDWLIGDDSAAEGGSCLKAPKQKAASSGTVSTTVEGAGRLSFYWKLVRRRSISTGNVPGDYGDTIALGVDGAEVVKIPAANFTDRTVAEIVADFTKVEYEVSGVGSHEIVWSFTCPKMSGDFQDEAVLAIDHVEWEPFTADYTRVVFDPAREDATVSPASRVVRKGEAVGVLPTPVCETRDFARWVDAAGNEATAATIVPERGLLLTAEWEAKSWTLSFDAGGADGDAPEPVKAYEGAEVVLPGQGGLAKGDNYKFAGWSDGEKVYGQGDRYTMGAGDVTLVAQWADARARRVLNIEDFTFSVWQIAEDESAEGGSCLKAPVQTAATTGTVTTVVSGPGTISFDWKLVRRISASGNSPSPGDAITLVVDGAEVARFPENDPADKSVAVIAADFTHAEYDISGDGEHEISWKFVYAKITHKNGLNNPNDAVLAIDNVVWIWMPDAPEVPVDFSEAEVSPTTTPADLGITEGAFAASETGGEELTNLVAWAKANNVTVAEVNAMTLEGGEAATDLEKAYLLDCSVDEIDEAVEEFNITGFAVDSEGNVTITPEDGSDYGNGHVEVRSSVTVDGEYTTGEKSGGTVFFKIHLVR